MPVDIFGSGVCAVVLMFFSAIAMMREINIFVDKYPPLEYTGDGSLLLLVVYMSRGLAVGMLCGWLALTAAAFLAIELGAAA